MKNVIIIGAGSMARIIYSYLCEGTYADQYAVKGFLDDNQNALEKYALEPAVIASPDQYSPSKDEIFIMSIAEPMVRKRLFYRYKELGASFLTFIHPLAYIAQSANLGEGCVVGPFANIAINTDLGACVFCNAYTSVGHDVSVGDFSILYSHCSVNGFCELGEGVLLGAHTVIVPEVKVGRYARVMAGSAVLASRVREQAIVAGVPAEEILVG